MKHRLIARMIAVGCAFAVAWFAPAVVSLAAWQASEAGPVPRMADGHPDLSGVWWGGSDIGAARGRGAGRGGGARGGGRGTPAPTFTSLYRPEATPCKITV